MNLTLLWKPRRLFHAIRSRLARRRAIRQAVVLARKRFANDPRWRLDAVPRYFLPNPGPPADDSALLQRIVVACRKAKQDQSSAGEAYNVSNEWLPIYKRQLGPAMAALLSGNLPELNRMYSNFFRDPCSAGLVGLPLDMPKVFFGGHIKDLYREFVLAEVLHRIELWKRRTGGIYTSDVLAAPLVGNPYGYTSDGAFVRAGGDYQHFYSHAIRGLLSQAEGSVVAELGGGFGGMAYYLLRDAPQATYIDLDLPEAVALASYYLLKSLPGRQFQLYGEGEFPGKLAPGVAYLMPSFTVSQLPARSVDVSFNSYSLAEMSPPTIRSYVNELTRVTRGYFLHVNHSRDSVVSADDFGIDRNGFTLLRRELAGWTAGNRPDADEMEYLYQSVVPGR